ncbi:hypothetical protein CP532_1707 [Ophiocordyceps camponoti-leonardi (nom. inval.)]|nr:hypothetical protein CP532_1707 [Ophiocordyceps camponoti-leonardi (nom. inval.)]
MSSGTPAAGGEDASRSRGILTPSSDESINCHGRRQVDDAGAMEELLRPSVAVKPHPSKLHVQPRLLLPLMLLPREHLSLSFIDLGASDRDLPPSRLFESRVKVLDLESRLGAATSILVARNDTRGTVHVLERQAGDDALYTMCQLGSWVDLAALATKATAVFWQRLRVPKRARPADGGDEGLTTPCLHKEQKRKRAAIEAIQSLVRKRARSQSVSTFEHIDRQVPAETGDNEIADSPPEPTVKSEQDQGTTVATITPGTSPIATSLDMTASMDPPATAEAIFDSIRSQYFDALYKSMGSLAYFVKGPLSRARSSFQVDFDSGLEMADLIEFLKSLILTTVQIDKKYRDTIPDLISKTKLGYDSSDENRSQRRRRPRKMRIGKSGLYPREDESIRKWWASKQPQQSDDDDNDDLPSPPQLRSHLSLLRTRETQLQMIIGLEILALEPLKAAAEAGEDSLPQLPGLEATEEAAPPQTKRNRHNIPVLIDVHADRLTIWQSTASDEQLLIEDSQVSRGSQLGGQSQQQRASSEPLKDFCVDIIVPFFSSRLPELCDAINRKLGGPLILPPTTSKSSKRAPGRREQKPGATAKRPAPISKQTTLQRALSTEQQHRRSVSRGPSSVMAIARMRSAKSTTPAPVKRQDSAPVGSKASRDVLKPISSNRPTLSHSLSAPTVAVGSKASQKALVEAELKDAISALRKPNREVVGKAMAEADECRVQASLSVKKVKKAAPRSSVQVKATPAHGRFRDVLAPGGRRSRDVLIPPTILDGEAVTLSSDAESLIPSTGHRPAHRDAFAVVASSSPPAAAVTRDVVIAATPMKPPPLPSPVPRPCFLRRAASEAFSTAVAASAPPSSPLAPARTTPRSVGRFDVTTDGGGSLFSSRRGNVASTPVKRPVADRLLSD